MIADINIRMSRTAHKRYKIAAAKRGLKLKVFLEANSKALNTQ
jgi:hypothetical protein